MPYRNLLENYLRQNQTTVYRSLSATGELKAYLEKTSEEMSETEELIRQRLLEKDPGPQKDFMARMQHLEWAQRTAKETVISEYLELPPSEETPMFEE